MTQSLTIAGSNPAAPLFLARLRSAGVDVTVLSAHLAQTPEAVSDIVGVRCLLLMPRDIMECEKLLFEVENISRNAVNLEMLILSATLSPRYVRALAARLPRHITLIDAPYTGTARAETDHTAFLLGGDAASLNQLQPIFDVLAGSCTRMGAFGTAMAAKALQDCLAAASSAMTRSALDWAEAQGIEENRLVSLLEATFGRHAARSLIDPATLVANALPGDNAGAVLVKNVESALDKALAGVHLNPPRNFDQVFASVRARHLH